MADATFLVILFYKKSYFINMKISHKFFRKYIANFAIIIALLCVGLIAYQGGAVGVFSSGNKIDAIYSGNPKNNTVSLMFNVYMGKGYVESILKTLEKCEARATFFVGGVWVEKNEECFMKIYNSGNEIGSHGYWHKDHDKISDNQQINEIALTEELIVSLTGFKMTLFAPPSGAFNNATLTIADSMGYKTIMWSKDTIDWRDQDEGLIFERATKNIKAGDLILMHPTKATAESLKQIIQEIKNKGLKISTVTENLMN